MNKKKRLLALALCGLVGTAQADEKEDLLKLKNTTTNLIKELVKQGVLTEQAANEMIQRAEKDAELQTKEAAAAQAADAPEPNEVRVPYVPEFVKDEIRQQVRKELREDVVGDVVQKAKKEKWGTPDALPDWVNRFKLSGDLRLRSQHDYFPEGNAVNPDGTSVHPNWQLANMAGGLSRAFAEDRFLPNTDRHRFRERFRLGIDAKLADELKAGVRLATGNIPDPVSTNQDMGITGSQYQFNVDRAFLEYNLADQKGFKWMTLTGGRIASPWYVGGGEFTAGSELLWDVDLSFEGVSGTFRYDLDNLTTDLKAVDADHPPHSVFLTLGGFPIQEMALSSHDKWLFGGQLGVSWGFENHDSLRAGVAYYDYTNLQARPNTVAPFTCDNNTPANNLSVPQFMQFGNTLAAVCRAPGGGGPDLVGLASDYNVINLNFSYDYSRFAPYHVIFGADLAKNVGFNGDSVNRFLLVNNMDADGNVSDQTNAWQARVDFGWPRVERSGQWNVFTFYKYVERDAVLDAFTDSDFHLGGTNTQGWVVGGNYGLMKNVWFTGRWLSSNVIAGPAYSIDTLQLDVNTKF